MENLNTIELMQNLYNGSKFKDDSKVDIYYKKLDENNILMRIQNEITKKAFIDRNEKRAGEPCVSFFENLINDNKNFINDSIV